MMYFLFAQKSWDGTLEEKVSSKNKLFG